MNATVLIVEDHPLFASGLRDLIKLIHPNATVLHTSDLRGAKRLLEQHAPVMIVSDLHLPDCTDRQLLDWLEHSIANIPTVIVTADLDFIESYTATCRPNLWAIAKQMSFEQMTDLLSEAFIQTAMMNMHDGGDAIHITQRLIERISHAPQKKELTDKQHQVMQLVSVGLSNKEIAREMNVSLETVKHHMKDIFDRLDVSSRTQAMAIFRQNRASDPLRVNP